MTQNNLDPFINAHLHEQADKAGKPLPMAPQAPGKQDPDRTPEPLGNSMDMEEFMTSSLEKAHKLASEQNQTIEENPLYKDLAAADVPKLAKVEFKSAKKI